MYGIKTSATTSNSLIKIDFFNSSTVRTDQQGMDPGTGTAYFDGIQLEKGAVLSAYNLLDNSKLERDADADNYPDNWDRGSLTTSDV